MRVFVLDGATWEVGGGILGGGGGEEEDGGVREGSRWMDIRIQYRRTRTRHGADEPYVQGNLILSDPRSDTQTKLQRAPSLESNMEEIHGTIPTKGLLTGVQY